MRPDNVYAIEDQNIGVWISPEGLFFQAHYCDHDYVAGQIVDNFLQVTNEYSPGLYLEKRDWIRLETSGDIWRFPSNPTVQQINILYHCYVHAYDSYYKDNLFGFISPTVLENAHVREPLPRVPAQGDQENLYVRIDRRVYA